MIVWERKGLPHSEKEWLRADNTAGVEKLLGARRKEEKRTAQAFIFAGPVLDIPLIWSNNPRCTVNSSIGPWARSYAPTDRTRAPIPLASIDTFHLYFMQLATIFRPLRTTDPNRDKGEGHTSWTDFFFPPVTTQDGDPQQHDHDPEQEFGIDHISGHRPNQAGNSFEYHVEWAEFEEGMDATWEERDSLNDTDALLDYEMNVLDGPDDALDPPPVGTTLAAVPPTTSSHNPSVQEKARGASFAGLRAHGVRQGTKDIIYAVIADGIFTGRGRAGNSPLKGWCPFCLMLDHVEIPETSRHLAWDCPYAKMIWDGTIRAFHLYTSSDDDLHSKVRATPSEDLLRTHSIACIFGEAGAGWRGEGNEGVGGGGAQ